MTTTTRVAVIFHNRHTVCGQMLRGDACLPGDICIIDDAYGAYCELDIEQRIPNVFFVLSCRAPHPLFTSDNENYISVQNLNDYSFMLFGSVEFNLKYIDVFVALESYAKLFDCVIWPRVIKVHIYPISNGHPWLHKHFGTEVSKRCIDSAVVVADRDGIQMVRITMFQDDIVKWWHRIKFDLFKHQFSASHLLQRLDTISTHSIVKYSVSTPAASSKQDYLDEFSCGTKVSPNCGPTILTQYIGDSYHDSEFVRDVTMCERAPSYITRGITTINVEEQRAMMEPIIALHKRVCGINNDIRLSWRPTMKDYHENRRSYDWYDTLAPRILQLCLLFSTMLSPYVLERVIDYLPYMMFPSHARKIALIIGCRDSVQRIIDLRAAAANE